MNFGKRKAVFGFLLSLNLLCLGCSTVVPEGAKTLMDQGKAEEKMKKALEQEEQSFQKVKAAIQEGKLKAGLSKSDINRRFGQPVVTAQEGTEERWTYKGKKEDWFKGSKIYLFFDQNKQLTSWQCVQIEGCPSKQGAAS